MGFVGWVGIADVLQIAGAFLKRTAEHEAAARQGVSAGADINENSSNRGGDVVVNFHSFR